ncbi:Caleosin-domain-containing protein, partial [Hesseltinella vesiculosa]
MTTNDLTTPDEMTEAMEKHVRFWDRKKKGYITPVDAMFGFINLGYGVIFSLTMGTFLGVLFSYATQDSWMPDPYCRTRFHKMQKGLPTDTPYNEEGKFDEDRFEVLFTKYAKSDISGQTITLKELMEWNEASFKDPVAWATRTLEWLTAYLFVGKDGIVKKDDVQAAFDGTLFYKMRERNKTSRAIQDIDSISDVGLSGVKVPKTVVRQLEDHLNQAVHLLPRSMVSTLDARFRFWYAQLNEHTPKQPILKGVATPQVDRRSLFTESDQASSSMETSLTGVKTFQFLDAPLSLTGVQGYDGPEDDQEKMEPEPNDALSDAMLTMTHSMSGLRPDGDAYYNDRPSKNWLKTRSLTGVVASATDSLYLEDDATSSEEEDLSRERQGLPVVGIDHSSALQSTADHDLIHDSSHEDQDAVPSFNSSGNNTGQGASPTTPLSPEVDPSKKNFDSVHTPQMIAQQ